MAPTRTTNLAESMPGSGERRSDSMIVRKQVTECIAPTYEGLARSLTEKPITQVAFYAYPTEDRSGIDFIELVPYDAELNGYGSFSLSNQEFPHIQRDFPKIDFIERRDMEARFAEQLSAHGVSFPLPEAIAAMDTQKKRRRKSAKRRAPEAGQTDTEAILGRLDELQEAARKINTEIVKLTRQAEALKK